MLGLVVAAPQVEAADMALALDALANDLHDVQSRQPPPDSLPENSEEGRLARAAAEDDLRARLAGIDADTLEGADRTTYEMLRQSLDADAAARVCRRDLWNIDHISGWHIALPALAARQPVGTDEARSAALSRWRQMGAFVDREIEKLKVGLDNGYSVPRPIVRRVIAQLAAKLDQPLEESPYYSPAQRDTDAAFREAMRANLESEVRPALRRYHAFLAQAYLPRARSSIGLSELPDGKACYRALLRQQTTLATSPEKVMATGRNLISGNRAAVQAIGAELFGETDYATILEKARTAAENKFRSADEALNFARSFVEASRARSAPLFHRLPDLELVVVPFPDYLSGSGMNPYYQPPQQPGQPARYLVNPESWRDDTRGFTEVVAVHEGWPGHHVQVTLARQLKHRNLFTQNAVYGAFAEGWARYVERLADEKGLYVSPYARIAWRMKPGFGMVADPGLHYFGWSRAEAADFLRSSGLFPSDQSVEDMIDRISVMPAQLTAYDSGGSEILALREEARHRLGAAFDLRDFHDAVLSAGFVPLSTLRRLVTAWIDEEAGR